MFGRVQMTFYSSSGCESWDVAAKPAIPEGMPVLIDDDLRFEDGVGQVRPTVAMNQWLRELPVSGCPSPDSWASYGRALRAWTVFLTGRGIDLFDARDRLRAGLSSYAEHRATGPLGVRFEATTWNQHMSIVSSFYRWAVAERYASAEPFTYRSATVLYGKQVRQQAVNMATRRTPKSHVTIKYLEADFAGLFIKALAGLRPDGAEDDGFRGWNLTRNVAVGRLALSTGLRRREFSSLLVYEIPPLPARPTSLPIVFPVPAAVTKGRKFRTTWISYEALAAVHAYIELDRALHVEGSRWHPLARAGAPLVITEADPSGGRVNGKRVRWEVLRPRSDCGWLLQVGVRPCCRSVPPARRSPPGPRCSPAPRIGSGSGGSRGFLLSIRTGCGTRSRWRPWNGWWAAITGRPHGW